MASFCSHCFSNTGNRAAAPGPSLPSWAHLLAPSSVFGLCHSQLSFIDWRWLENSSVCLLPLPSSLFFFSCAREAHLFYTHMYMCNPIPDHSPRTTEHHNRHMDTGDTHTQRHDCQQPCITPPVLHSSHGHALTYTWTHTHAHTLTYAGAYVHTHTHFTPFLLYLS